MSTTRFDQAAASWDEAPHRVEMARNIAAAMLAQVPVRPAMTAIDFGCGTGLLTLALQPAFRQITGIDSSPGMIGQLQEKIARGNIESVDTCLLDLTVASPPEDLRADVIVSAMALHHIQDIAQLLRIFSAMLLPGGYLALADLDREDGSFHADASGVHHAGIHREWLMNELEQLGFADVQASTAHVVQREDPQGGQQKRYPIFLVSGRRIG